MPQSRFSGGSPVTSRSPIRIEPAVGGSKPAIMRRVVVLPQPDGPRSAMSSPSAIRRERASTARTSPNRFVRELSVMPDKLVSRTPGSAVARHPLVPNLHHVIACPGGVQPDVVPLGDLAQRVLRDRYQLCQLPADLHVLVGGRPPELLGPLALDRLTQPVVDERE